MKVSNVLYRSQFASQGACVVSLRPVGATSYSSL
jgi:hypothetical protein